MLSEVNEIGRGQDFSKFDRDNKGYVKPLEDAEVADTRKADVLTKTAKETGVIIKRIQPR